MRLALTVLAIAGLLAGPAVAPVLAQNQEPGAPLRLVAPAPLPDKEKPVEKPAEATPAGIGGTDLGPLDPSWGDALPQGETALPNDMWAGTSRGILRGLLPLLGPSDSPAWRALARRVLLSAAASPPGADPADQPSLALLRAQALARLGDFAGAKAVLDNFPADKRGEPAERLRIELAFAGGDIADACKRVADGLAAHKNAWWDQGNIACQLLQGHRDLAALSLDVLHDSGAEPDPLFDMLAAAASGKAAKLEKRTVLTPMRALMWGAGRRPLPADVLAADAATLAAYANGKAAPQYRLAPAERAASLGAWPPEKLVELYGKMKFTDDERAGALAAETIGDLPAGRALLFSIAQQDADAARRVAALLRFLGAAKQRDLGFVAARMAAPIIATLAPSPATKEAAPFFVRALIAADRVKDIAPWLPLLDGPATDPLVILVQAIDGARSDDKAMEISLAALMLRGRDSTREIGLYLTLMSEYGAAPAASMLAAQMGPARPSAVPSAAVWLDLQRVQASHRLGETILASLVLAQDGADLTAEPIVVQRVVSALRAAAGLDAETRALARDVAVASGL